MNHIALDNQDEAVKRFVLGLPISPQGAVIELGGRPVAMVIAPVAARSGDRQDWTDADNKRRCELIDGKYALGLTPVEANELAELQERMLRYRQQVAPLPLEEARLLHQELLMKAAGNQENG